jgi:hypothetical protein
MSELKRQIALFKAAYLFATKQLSALERENYRAQLRDCVLSEIRKGAGDPGQIAETALKQIMPMLRNNLSKKVQSSDFHAVARR